MKTITIGRDVSCDVVIIDQTNVVSRRHAIIEIDNLGRMTITDCSSNGTYINGIKMSENVPIPVTRKDTISFAHTQELDWNSIPNIKARNIIIASAFVILIALIVTIVLVLCRKNDIAPSGFNNYNQEEIKQPSPNNYVAKDSLRLVPNDKKVEKDGLYKKDNDTKSKEIKKEKKESDKNVEREKSETKSKKQEMLEMRSKEEFVNDNEETKSDSYIEMEKPETKSENEDVKIENEKTKPDKKEKKSGNATDPIII